MAIAAMVCTFLLAGCVVPSVGYDKLIHYPEDASVVEGSLFLTGGISPFVAPPDYGVKLVEAHDDTGETLSLKSFSFMFVKGMWFTLELSPPSESAQNVAIEAAFLSGGGVQRVKWTLPIHRDRKEHPFFAPRWDERGNGKGGSPTTTAPNGKP